MSTYWLSENEICAKKTRRFVFERTKGLFDSKNFLTELRLRALRVIFHAVQDVDEKRVTHVVGQVVTGINAIV